MTTTIVTGTGRRSSIRQSELQASAPVSNAQSMTSPIDEFPPFKDELYDTTAEATEPASASTVRYTPGERWEPRRANYPPRDLKPIRPQTKHRSRKSISEAISTIRTRNASVSANAQELAEALRAPVSYRLIVRSTSVPSAPEIHSSFVE